VSLISKPRLALLAAAALLALAGCGRRGELEAPDAAAVQTPAKDDMGVRKANPKIAPPKKDFVLDPLLQ
jgi:predicted small lipoprotein YifL